ncbi:MAG: NIPSNAP family protein [Acidobacteria bacterium]|nr:NIPSNAP family protein [Acidobacteriota bacterium]MBI3279478.1 NIPSNAP family protein [Acidobacteriota bacterium]
MLKKLLLPLFLLAMTVNADDRIYELRTYTTLEGKLPDLLARFRNHTIKLFEKHGMVNVGYWIPADAPRSQNTLIYVLAHKNRDAAKKSWDAFRSDSDWVKARTESEKNGKIVEKVESVYMNPADFSKLK